MMYAVIFLCIYLGIDLLIKLTCREPLSDKSFLRLHPKNTVVSLAAKMIRISPKKAEQMKKKLVKAGFSEIPEEFIARGAIKALPISAMALFFILSGNVFFGLYLSLLGILFYRIHTNKLEKKLEEIDLMIIEDLPEFMSYVTNCLKSDKDILGIIETYLDAANPAFENELDKLRMDLKTGNTDEALINFDMRLNIPHVSNFISVVRATLDGEPQSAALEVITIDMEFYEYESAKKRADELPGKISKATFAVAGSMMLFFMVILGYSLILGLSKFN